MAASSRRWPLASTSSLSARLALTLLAAAAAGCASREFGRLMQSWDGKPLEELLVTWGNPTYTFSDGKGGQVIVYLPPEKPDTPRDAAREKAFESFQSETATSRPVYNSTVSKGWPIYRIFFVNEGEKIDRSEWRGRWELTDEIFR
jgi:hypothetical protein